MVKRLPYLRDLGINAIQVLPPAEFAGGFSWGYNPAHIFAIESDYGGPDALKNFIQEAHRLGIAVLFEGTVVLIRMQSIQDARHRVPERAEKTAWPEVVQHDVASTNSPASS